MEIGCKRTRMLKLKPLVSDIVDGNCTTLARWQPLASLHELSACLCVCVCGGLYFLLGRIYIFTRCVSAVLPVFYTRPAPVNSSLTLHLYYSTF